MLRWTTCLAVLVAVFASTTELEAQRRAPLRNLMRSIGHGWSSGYHSSNPGHNSSYYSPWSERNTWTGESEIINQQTPGISPQTTPSTRTPTVEPNSASRLLNQPGTTSNQIMHNPYYQRGNIINQSDQSQIIQGQQIIQQRIKQLPPYHTKTTNPAAIEINHGGEFQVPANNSGWDSYRYDREFNKSRPFSPQR